MTERPEPLVGCHVDISRLDGFMLDTVRLLGSELVALSTGDEFKAAVLLWSRAWKQVPACSLPNDDRVLASFAMVPINRWRKVKAMALRGFIECSDGRLYHRVLSEDAMRAWEALERRRDRTRAATEARKGLSQNERHDQRNDVRDERRDDQRNGDRSDQRNEVPYTARDGTGRDGTVKNPQQQQSPSPLPREPVAAPRQATELIETFDRICREVWPESPRPWPAASDGVTAEKWRKAGVDGLIVGTVANAVLSRRKAQGKACPTSLAFLDGAVMEALQTSTNDGPSSVEAPPKRKRWTTYSDEKIRELEAENAAREAAKGAA